MAAQPIPEGELRQIFKTLYLSSPPPPETGPDALVDDNNVVTIDPKKGVPKRSMARETWNALRDRGANLTPRSDD